MNVGIQTIIYISLKRAFPVSKKKGFVEQATEKGQLVERGERKKKPILSLKDTKKTFSFSGVASGPFC